jgi:hypothetical protein
MEEAAFQLGEMLGLARCTTWMPPLALQVCRCWLAAHACMLVQASHCAVCDESKLEVVPALFARTLMHAVSLQHEQVSMTTSRGRS